MQLVNKLWNQSQIMGLINTMSNNKTAIVTFKRHKTEIICEIIVIWEWFIHKYNLAPITVLLHYENVGQTFTHRWFNYEQPYIWVNNYEHRVKCWLIIQLLHKFMLIAKSWVKIHQQLVNIINPNSFDVAVFAEG